MATRRSALGRGLGALIQTPPSQPAESRTTTTPAHTGIQQIPVDQIDPNPDQPRRVFATAQLESLTESIRLHGVLQPVVVRASLSRPGRYELIVGERRWRATRAAGLKVIPVVVSESGASDLLELAIVENVQRHDLNPMELAHAYRTLADRGATQDEIGDKVSQSRSSIANHLRLLELSREIQSDVEEERLSMGHAKALLQVTNPERRRHLRDKIVKDGLSVREAERRARDAGAPRQPRAKAAAPAEGEAHPELSEMLQRRLQARVRVKSSGAASGRIEIEYSSAEDLDRIASLLLEGPP